MGTEQEVEKLLGKDMAQRAKNVAMKLYQRGSELMRKRGLILIDTKYEFGLDDKGVVHGGGVGDEVPEDRRRDEKRTVQERQRGPEGEARPEVEGVLEAVCPRRAAGDGLRPSQGQGGAEVVGGPGGGVLLQVHPDLRADHGQPLRVPSEDAAFEAHHHEPPTRWNVDRRLRRDRGRLRL